MIIGSFITTTDGFSGLIGTISHQVALTFTQAPKGADYRITTEGFEVGAAWRKTSQAGKSYLSVKLDSPFLPAPIYCALMPQTDGTHALIWTRDERKAD